MPSSSTMRRDDASIRRAASVRPRSASSTAWQRSATASTAGAPCVMRSTRTTSRQRPLARVTGLGPHSAASGAPASTAFERRRSRARRAAASARSSAASQAPTLPRRASASACTECAFASPAASPAAASAVGRGRDRVGGRAQRLRIGERGELAGEAGVPRAQARRVAGEAAELVDRPRRRADVAGGEQRLAPVEGQVGARGIRRVEPIERASEQARRQRQVVARERAPAGRREVARRPLAERPTLRVERAELAQVLVRLLEVPADRLVVLDRVADPRLEPVGEARVQLGARVLEEAPVGRVADQHVVEAEHGLAEEPARVRLDQLAPPERLEARVEVGRSLAAAGG